VRLLSYFNKVKNGLIYIDDFTDTRFNSNFIISPSNAEYEIVIPQEENESGILRIHNENTSGDNSLPHLFLKDMPEESYVIEIQQDYIPTGTETGGIILYKSNQDFIELINKKDQIGNYYSGLRIVKSKNIISAYGLRTTGAWDFISKTGIGEITKAGIVYYTDGSEENSDFEVSKIKIYRDMNLTFLNAIPGMKVNVKNADGEIVRTEICPEATSFMKINLESLTIEDKTIELISPSNRFIDSISGALLCGGDIWNLGYQVELWKGNEKFQPSDFYRIESLINNQREVKFTLKNSTESIFVNSLIKSKQYFDYPGYDLVEVAEDIGGRPDIYQSSITIFNLIPGQTIDFWLRVNKREPLEIGIEENKFFLEIVVGGG